MPLRPNSTRSMVPATSGPICAERARSSSVTLSPCSTRPARSGAGSHVTAGAAATERPPASANLLRISNPFLKSPSIRSGSKFTLVTVVKSASTTNTSASRSADDRVGETVVSAPAALPASAAAAAARMRLASRANTDTPCATLTSKSCRDEVAGSLPHTPNRSQPLAPGPVRCSH
ncbi:MAG: hypothetical protein BWY85_01344 [Firmicutes bacterium ADurb.Bin506]|nr:MAG: hypothetical protein BWY85_01344 [Firmicutes bacterium ADurb.Bin506]